MHHRSVVFGLVSLTSLGALAPAQTPASLGRRATVYLGEPWNGIGGNPQHTAQAPVASQPLTAIHWTAPVDLQPQYTGSTLYAHYGSPSATAQGTVVLPVKTGAFDGFRFEGRSSSTGALLWTMATDYSLPAYGWVPVAGATLLPRGELAVPAAGGTILIRASADAAVAGVRRACFFGLANYLANAATYDALVRIDTPITCDAAGNLFFGFVVTGTTPLGLQSGIARLGADGTATWTAAATAAADPAIQKVTYNCAPALSRDGQDLYVGVNYSPGSGFAAGYLLRLDSRTLALRSRVQPLDVLSPSNAAVLPDDGSGAPMVGPDGDVYFGVLEANFGANHLRGWMAHYDRTLAIPKIPGAFGWDCTPSVVPRACVPSYTGTSPYLLFTKYNDYGGVGGTGINKIAVLDPFASMLDPSTGATVMLEVLTKAGPTPDPSWPGGVKEWCINSCAVDVERKCALANSEDGKLYRWDFVTDTLSETMVLTAGLGEAYTPTIVGPDGTVFAINNATLFAVGR